MRKIRYNSLIAPMIALAAVSVADAVEAPLGFKFESGRDITCGSKDGEVFEDSRGRKYVRDAKGTIRRVKQ